MQGSFTFVISRGQTGYTVDLRRFAASCVCPSLRLLFSIHAFPLLSNAAFPFPSISIYIPFLFIPFLLRLYLLNILVRSPYIHIIHKWKTCMEKNDQRRALDGMRKVNFCTMVNGYLTKAGPRGASASLNRLTASITECYVAFYCLIN